jgi:PKD repeat protein
VNCSNITCDADHPEKCNYGYPLVENGGFKLNRTSGTKVITNVGLRWNGAFWGRTGCVPTNSSDLNSPIACKAGAVHNLPSGYDSVSPGGGGASNPSTKFEFAFDGGIVNPNTPDVYDISFVDGYNSPVKLDVVNGTHSKTYPGFTGNLSGYYCNTSGTAADLNQIFKMGTYKLNRSMAIWDGKNVSAFYSACSYTSNILKPKNQTLVDMTCCLGPYGSNKSAPVHCDPDNWPKDLNTAKIFKDNYPMEYSYAYDDGKSTFGCQGLPERNTEYVISFCKPPNSTVKLAALNAEVASYAWVPEEKPGTYFWQHPLGGSDLDYGQSIESTADGGYIVAGYAYSDDGDIEEKVTGSDQADFWVVKLDASGRIVWEKTLGGSEEDNAYDVIQTADGGYLVVGYTASDDFQVSGKIAGAGNSDFWVVRLDASGTILWNKCYGGSDSDVARHVLETTDGGYIIAGYTYSDDHDVTGKINGWMNADYWIIRIDATGTLVWQKIFGGTGDDYAEAVSLLDDGYLVTGHTTSNDTMVSGNHGNNDFWILKIDTSGTMVWQKCFGGSLDDLAYDSIPMAGGGGMVAGQTYSNDGQVSGNHGEDDIWLVRFDSSGNLVSQKCYGGSDSEEGFEIAPSPSGGYLVSGSSQSRDGDLTGNYGIRDVWVFEITPAGDIIWQKNLGGSLIDYGNSVTVSDEGHAVVAGYTNSYDHDVSGQHGLYDMWVVDLVPKNFEIHASSDPWTITYPPGNRSYTEATNATYLTQAKPGADLLNVTVDSQRYGPNATWTFMSITSNHTISSSGEPTPGQVHALFSLNKTWGPVPLSVQFTNQSLGSPTSWSWEFGDGGTSALENPIHTFTVPGTYSVTLRALNNQTGGVAILNNAVTATSGLVPEPTPTPVPGSVHAAFSADMVVGTAPMQVQFTDQSTGNPTSWLWDFGDGTISTGQNPTRIYDTKGTYTVTLTTRNSISSGSLSIKDYITAV